MSSLLKSSLGLVFLFFCLSTVAIAQTPPPQPATTQSAQVATAQQSTKPGVPTLHAGTQLVVVDVVVTDKNHNPVHNLQQSDFTLTEENATQVIKHFEEHTALTPADATKFPPMPKLPPGIFTNFTPEPVNGAVNILLLDALNTPLKDQMFVRQQLLAYLNAAPPGTRIAIFGLTTRLIILQGFTSDPALLKAVASASVGKNSPLLDDSVGGGGIQKSMADDMEDAGVDATIVANMRQFDAQQQSFQLQLRAKYTLDAMSQLARYLSSIAGRKNLIWFSGSFPISILPDTTGTLPDPFAAMADSEEEFRDTVNLLARSQVAVYPIDARGLSNSPVFSATTTRNYTRYPSRMNQDQAKFFSDTAAEHSTMQEMADATGGHAFYNTNGLAQAVAAAITDGSNFYTLTYTPTNQNRDAKFRKIKVQLARQGLTLAYRHGYYADDPDKGPPSLEGASYKAAVTDAAVTSGTPTAMQSLRSAVMRGSPTPTEILFKVAVLPTGPPTQTEDTPAPGNVLVDKTHGPFRRYAISYAISPSDITFLRTSDGKIHANFELAVFLFNPEGLLVNSVTSDLHIGATVDELKKNVAGGIQYRQEISAPAKGVYFFRIVVHDLPRNRFGAVELATSSVKNLPPAPIPATAPPPSPSPAAAPAPTAPAPR
jgi:VWFA-related protein